MFQSQTRVVYAYQLIVCLSNYAIEKVDESISDMHSGPLGRYSIV